MLALLLALVAGAAAGTALALSGTSSVPWSVVWGVLGFGAAFVAVAWIVRRRVTRVMNAMQEDMLAGQEALKRKIVAWQNNPRGDPRRVQAAFEKDQAALVDRALEATKALEPFRGWIPFFGRQIATTRMQLLYQLKRFKEVDAILPRCLVLDPLSAAMKLARQFSTDAPLADIEKTYRKARLRLRYNQSAFLSSVMAWIYVKRDKLDDAHKLLDQACKDNNTEQEPGASLVRNRDALANNRVKQFTNAAFADQWYALFLEEPKVRYERRAPTRFGRFG